MPARRVATRASRQRGTAGVAQQLPQQGTEEVAVGQQVAVTEGGQWGGVIYNLPG